MTEAICPGCGSIFTLTATQRMHQRRGDRLSYCSKSCATRYGIFSGLSLEERFWAKAIKTAECWLWSASRNQQGYGLFMGKPRWDRCMLAHRVAWILTKGEIPEGLGVLHRCDNPRCVNPDHLWLGTNTENMQDMSRKGRHRGMTGKRHPYNRKGKKLSRQMAEEIRRSPGTCGEIAEDFGISPSMVSRIRTGECWRR